MLDAACAIAVAADAGSIVSFEASEPSCVSYTVVDTRLVPAHRGLDHDKSKQQTLQGLDQAFSARQA